MTDSQIALANERVSIFQACRMVGVDVPDFGFGSAKVYCPFGELYHADGGISKAFRVYPPSNSAYCFACGKYFDPVRLVATDRGISNEDAAESLLEYSGYVPPDFESRWTDLTTSTETIDTEYLSEALKVACARYADNWNTLQFEPPIASVLAKCLSLLPAVRTAADADNWLTKTKIAMRTTLGAHSGT